MNKAPTPLLSVTRRLRSTPFSRKVAEAGIQAYTVYNRMLLPTVLKDVVSDCQHLKKNVQLWDVSCERQIAIEGKEAATLVQKITPRNLSNQRTDRCMYIPIVDDTGGMLNDPVCIKFSDTHYWISIADSDLLFWIKGIAVALKLDVKVYEPPIYPLAVQGPQSFAVMENIFGSEINKMPFFSAKFFTFKNESFLISRSGYSKQGGFEIYVKSDKKEGNIGEQLWDALMEAGKKFDIRAGGPNYIERVESGLLSYGNDMTSDNTPDECGLQHFCDETIFAECIGGTALKKRREDGFQQQIKSLSIAGGAVPACRDPWVITKEDKVVGQVSSAIWSPDFNTNVALAMIHQPYWQAGTTLTVHCPDGERQATVCEKSFN